MINTVIARHWSSGVVFYERLGDEEPGEPIDGGLIPAPIRRTIKRNLRDKFQVAASWGDTAQWPYVNFTHENRSYSRKIY